MRIHSRLKGRGIVANSYFPAQSNILHLENAVYFLHYEVRLRRQTPTFFPPLFWLSLACDKAEIRVMYYTNNYASIEN